MADKEYYFDGQRNTWLYRQTPGVRNAKYPWVIMQGNNGAVVKFDESQMRGIVNAYLEAMGFDILPDWRENA